MSVATMRRPAVSEQPGVRAIYLMAKPPPDVLARIGALPRNDAARALELRHVTLLPFGFAEERPAEFVDELCDKMAGFIANAAYVRFDRIAERSAVTLRAIGSQKGV
jgi:2'-5' RNA ligase